MSGRLSVESGTRFGRLSVVIEHQQRCGRRRFLCRCDCGALTIVDMAKLRSGRTRSCGCLAREINALHSVTHGQNGRPLYRVWAAMKSRCANPNVASFGRYGGRGISVCEEWLEYARFQVWADTNGYRSGLTLDRIDNDGNYEPGNCQWVSRSRQANNRTSSRLVAYRGEIKSIADWSRTTGLAAGVIWKRLNRGWSAERALTTLSSAGGRYGH